MLEIDEVRNENIAKGKNNLLIYDCTDTVNLQGDDKEYQTTLRNVPSPATEIKQLKCGLIIWLPFTELF